MAALCRQRALFQGENDEFWIKEAEEWDRLLADSSELQFEKDGWPDLGPICLHDVHDEDGAYPLRYRCPADTSERDFCQLPCTLVIERNPDRAI